MRLRLGETSPKNVKTLARTTPLSFAEKAQIVIKDAIERMPTGRWYSVPTTKDEGKRPNSICQGFGMEFNAIAPVLLHASILAIRTKKDGTKELFYKKKGFEILQSKYAMLRDLRIEETRSSGDNRSRHYFILRGKVTQKGGKLPTYATGDDIPQLPMPKNGPSPGSLEKVKVICEDVWKNVEGIHEILGIISPVAATPNSLPVLVTDYSSNEEQVELVLQKQGTDSPLNDLPRPNIVTPTSDNESIEVVLRCNTNFQCDFRGL
jgi:hypothetical protein